jgi:hypothetical protein
MESMFKRGGGMKIISPEGSGLVLNWPHILEHQESKSLDFASKFLYMDSKNLQNSGKL